MRFGIQINPYFDGPSGNVWDAVAAASRFVDRTRFDSLWVYDHLLYEGGYSGHPVTEPVMEAFTILGAIAAITDRVRLGQLVLGTPYRNPALTAKMATTLDLISHGRSILGIGAGWHKREYEAYGYGAWEDTPIRMRRLEESIKLIRAFWTERPASFSGRYYQLHAAMENPAPVQKPHPPVLIGGSGEIVTLRLVAQHAQMCNVSGDPATVGRRFGILREHCEKHGRPYEEITRTIYTTIIMGKDHADAERRRDRWADFVPRQGAVAGTPDEVIDQLAAYARVGCQYVIFRTPDWMDAETLHLFDRTVLPALASA